MESGIFWNEVPAGGSKGAQVARALPPIPESDWRPPQAFPDLSSAKKICIDTETHDPDLKAKGPGVKRDGYIAGISVGTDDGFREYYPIAHAIGENCDKEQVFMWLRQELGRSNQEKVGARLIYDLDYLAEQDVHVKGTLRDVQIAEPLINENAYSFSLETLSQKYLEEGKVEDEMSKWLSKAFGPKNIKGNIWQAPASIVAPYAIGDVDLPLRILEKQQKVIDAEDLQGVFDLESRVTPMLVDMRQRGVRVDLEAAEKASVAMRAGVKETLDRIKHLSGKSISLWGSGPAAAFDAMDIPYPKTAIGNPSFTKPWLEHHPSDLARLVKEGRTLDKICGTFVEGAILNSHVDGRIYGEFNQLRSDTGGAVSGRFSSSNPNLQNIPARDPIYGPLLRGMFLPEEGQSWWKLDWSQIEYRIIVHYANILGLRGAAEAAQLYCEDPTADFHQAIADMTGLEREDAKTLNFGLAYGQGIDLLCYNLGVSREEGMEIIATYHDKAPFLRALTKETSSRVRTRGYLTTLMGRRRRFEDWEDSKGNLYSERGPGRKRAKLHKTLNGLIQGGAADIMKKAMAEVQESGALDVLGAPHLTVHDELDGSLDPHDPLHVEALAEVKRIMETCFELTVPMIADGDIGANWAEAA